MLISPRRQVVDYCGRAGAENMAIAYVVPAVRRSHRRRISAAPVRPGGDAMGAQGPDGVRGPAPAGAHLCTRGFAAAVDRQHLSRRLRPTLQPCAGYTCPKQPSAVPILHRCHIPNAMPATGSSVAVRLCSCSGQNATTGSVTALVCSWSAQRHLWCDLPHCCAGRATIAFQRAARSRSRVGGDRAPARIGFPSAKRRPDFHR